MPHPLMWVEYSWDPTEEQIIVAGNLVTLTGQGYVALHVYMGYCSVTIPGESSSRDGGMHNSTNKEDCVDSKEVLALVLEPHGPNFNGRATRGPSRITTYSKYSQL
jgi:hypothetical protein